MKKCPPQRHYTLVAGFKLLIEQEEEGMSNALQNRSVRVLHLLCQHFRQQPWRVRLVWVALILGLVLVMTAFFASFLVWSAVRFCFVQGVLLTLERYLKRTLDSKTTDTH